MEFTKDIVIKLLVPIISVVLTKLFDLYGKQLGNPRPTRKYRFDKILMDKKIDILNKIDELKEKKVTPYINVQVKFLYESLGIYLPAWHAHQLIRYIASENMSSIDVRLSSFLRYPVIGNYSVEGFSVNAKKANKLYWVGSVFGMVAVLVLIMSGWNSVLPYWRHQSLGLFLVFFCIYFAAVIFVVYFMFSLIENTWLAVQFGRVFELWLEHNPQSEN
ncbi:hypothetical protein QQF54_10930 [Lelliottia sp. V106_10]|uniref:hypothetical protein n=1 Tax=Lelliottia TaxID=1330545 RepID=UPI00254AC19C|nr:MULTISPECIES: hypothetical protein [unclassified Lelliottia]MDK9355722.1 hypothetical protein [Lelliottia sp. V106_16]MDK9373859.1 hypothetical protein [Lelliottia sp. V106_10]MDK9601769.1 hypothetical protein [Lelliottia sp. V106_5]